MKIFLFLIAIILLRKNIDQKYDLSESLHDYAGLVIAVSMFFGFLLVGLSVSYSYDIMTVLDSESLVSTARVISTGPEKTSIAEFTDEKEDTHRISVHGSYTTGKMLSIVYPKEKPAFAVALTFQNISSQAFFLVNSGLVLFILLNGHMTSFISKSKRKRRPKLRIVK